MARYIQHPTTHKLILAEIYVRPKEGQHAVHDDLESFVSPIDGSVVSGRKQYDDHCKKHNVVNAADYTPEFYARKKHERENKENTKAVILERRQKMYELMLTRER
jgi:hypothetical protein